jgi:hypothetical protein
LGPEIPKTFLRAFQKLGTFTLDDDGLNAAVFYAGFGRGDPVAHVGS